MVGKRSKRLRQSEVGAEGNLNMSDSSNTTIPVDNNPAHMDLSMYEELTTRCNELEQRCATLAERYENLLQEVSPHNSSNLASATPTTVECVVHREDSVPHFKAEVSAAFPLKRNQEVESWLRAIENIVKPANDGAYIRAARASCRGNADLIINSPVFDGISIWSDFKALIRAKFRGTCSSTEFFKHLHGSKMAVGQAPLDFFVSIEGLVYQGYRDYPVAIGVPDELIRRVFLQGLPHWLREALALKEDDSLPSLVDAAQRIWNLRMTSSKDGPSVPSSHDSRPMRLRQVASIVKYCQYHQSNTHNTEECRLRQRSFRCYNCQGIGHFARQCPFSPPHGRTWSSPACEGFHTGRPGEQKQRSGNQEEPNQQSNNSGEQN